MIIEPTVSELMTKVPDKYELILTVAQRAREIRDGADKLTSFDHVNNITIAAYEVGVGVVKPAYRKEEN